MTNNDFELNPNLKQGVLNKIQEKKLIPKSKNYFIVLDLMLAVALCLTLFTSSFLISLYVYDLLSFLWPLDLTALLDPQIWTLTGLEFLIGAFVLLVCVYLIYRQTEWPLVRRAMVMGLTLVILTLTLSVALVQAVALEEVNQFFSDTVSKWQTILPHSGRSQMISKKLIVNGISVGRVTEIKPTYNPFDGSTNMRVKVILSYPNEFDGQIVEFTDNHGLRVGDLVKISIINGEISKVEKVDMPYRYRIDIIYSHNFKNWVTV